MINRKFRELNQELQAALQAARSAGKIQMTHFKKDAAVEIKADRSPVTSVDRDCEHLIVRMIQKKFPRDGFLGEESGEHQGSSGRRWIIDPIDGTRPYIYGLPFFSTLIALERDGERVLGVIYLPAMDEICYAVKGGGAFLNRKPIRVSMTAGLSSAHGAVLGWNQPGQYMRPLRQLCKKAGYLFGFNDAYSYAGAACGRMDFVVSAMDKPWDNAPISIIIHEAGGRFSDFRGVNAIDSGCTVVSNGLIHNQILEMLNPGT